MQTHVGCAFQPLVHVLIGKLHALQVNYVGKAANLYEDAGYKLHGSSYVINKYLGTTWLWDRVRVSGGAYGGFSDFDPHSGMFTYLSYRDPNLLKTVDNYDGERSSLHLMSSAASAQIGAVHCPLRCLFNCAD